MEEEGRRREEEEKAVEEEERRADPVSVRVCGKRKGRVKQERSVYVRTAACVQRQTLYRQRRGRRRQQQRLHITREEGRAKAKHARMCA